MSKLIFRPVSIVAGLLAGLTGKKLFRGLWRIVDKDEPPRPEQRPAPLALLPGARDGRRAFPPREGPRRARLA